MNTPDHSHPGLEFLGGIFERMSLRLTPRLGKSKDDWLVIEIDGPDVQGLINRPELVSALALLTGQAINQATDERVRVVLDPGGQFDARQALLEQAADDIARAVLRTGRRAVLDGLTASERRVVHTQLAEDDRVNTRSEGDDRARLLLVEPA